jgi:acyl-coenzyme A synthetase/AMP-(fatty) acid ligase
VQLAEAHNAEASEITAFVKARIGSVKTPKVIHVWPDLPRSKVGKILKAEIKSELIRKVAE